MTAAQVAVVPRAGRAEVEAFYRRELGRDVPLGPSEEVIAARDNGVVVGSLRLFPANGTLVLRTVVVADGRRGQGIGRAMLRLASELLGDRECYCFPWTHLERFYGEIGLRPIERERVPAELLQYLGDDCIPTLRTGR